MDQDTSDAGWYLRRAPRLAGLPPSPSKDAAPSLGKQQRAAAVAAPRPPKARKTSAAKGPSASELQQKTSSHAAGATGSVGHGRQAGTGAGSAGDSSEGPLHGGVTEGADAQHAGGDSSNENAQDKQNSTADSDVELAEVKRELRDLRIKCARFAGLTEGIAERAKQQQQQQEAAEKHVMQLKTELDAAHSQRKQEAETAAQECQKLQAYNKQLSQQVIANKAAAETAATAAAAAAKQCSLMDERLVQLAMSLGLDSAGEPGGWKQRLEAVGTTMHTWRQELEALRARAAATDREQQRRSQQAEQDTCTMQAELQRVQHLLAGQKARNKQLSQQVSAQTDAATAAAAAAAEQRSKMDERLAQLATSLGLDSAGEPGGWEEQLAAVSAAMRDQEQEIADAYLKLEAAAQAAADAEAEAESEQLRLAVAQHEADGAGGGQGGAPPQQLVEGSLEFKEQVKGEE